MDNGIINSYISDKVVLSGDRLEKYSYSVPIMCDFKREYSIKKDKSKNNEKRIDNLERARQSVRRIIWCNLTPYTKFLTLTTKENIQDKKVFKRKMTTFLQALKRNGYDLDYLYVFERQKRGAIHAHLVVFNAEYLPMKVLKKYWRNGTPHIKILNGLKYGTDERICDAGAYICKYITKETVNEWGSHCYECSQGLKRPIDFNLKVYGARDIGFLENPNDVYKKIADAFESATQFNYIGSKIINYEIGYSSINQIIDYKQGIIKGDIDVRFD